MIFLATSVLLLRGGESVGPTLSLLGHFLIGYDVSWGGALLGAVEALLGGFALGFLLGRAMNFLIAFEERRLLSRFELEQILDAVAEYKS